MDREAVLSPYSAHDREDLAEIFGAVDVLPPAEREKAGWNLLRAHCPNEDDFIQRYFWIKRRGVGSLSQLIYREEQRKLAEQIRVLEAQRKPVRLYTLKSRQVGVSTFFQGKKMYRVLTQPFYRAAVIAHNKGASQEIFEIGTRILRNLPFRPPIEIERRDEIQTKADSKYTVLTAGNEDIGRATSAHGIHFSEGAFYDNGEIVFDGVMQTVGREPGTSVFFETTANGIDNFACDLWNQAVSGKSDWIPIFFPWWQHPSYSIPVTKERAEQIAETMDEEERWLVKAFKLDAGQIEWRRVTIETNLRGSVPKFHQEYPSHPEEAFLSSGQPVFNQRKLRDLLQEARDPILRGELVWLHN